MYFLVNIYTKLKKLVYNVEFMDFPIFKDITLPVCLRHSTPKLCLTKLKKRNM